MNYYLFWEKSMTSVNISKNIYKIQIDPPKMRTSVILWGNDWKIYILHIIRPSNGRHFWVVKCIWTINTSVEESFSRWFRKSYSFCPITPGSFPSVKNHKQSTINVFRWLCVISIIIDNVAWYVTKNIL